MTRNGGFPRKCCVGRGFSVPLLGYFDMILMLRSSTLLRDHLVHK